MSDEEAIAITRTMMLRGFPKPIVREAMSAEGRKRLQDFAADSYAKRLDEIGIGFALEGQLVLADPTLAYALLVHFGVLDKTDTALTLAYTSFGSVTVIIKAGHEISIDPIMKSSLIYEGVSDGPPWIDMNLATTIESSTDQVKGPEAQIGVDGKNLHDAVERRLGKLDYGKCYMLEIDNDTATRFSAQAVTKANLLSYIMEAQAKRPFEITRIPYNEPAEGGEAWGDDWGNE